MTAIESWVIPKENAFPRPPLDSQNQEKMTLLLKFLKLPLHPLFWERLNTWKKTSNKLFQRFLQLRPPRKDMVSSLMLGHQTCTMVSPIWNIKIFYQSVRTILPLLGPLDLIKYYLQFFTFEIE